MDSSDSSACTSVSSHRQPSNPSHILEISLISAQDLAPVTRSMRTYAVVWIHPNRKLSTRIDQRGERNPKWNEKFSFSVDEELLFSEEATLDVEIYTMSWFRDVLVGTVRVLMSDLITSSARTADNSNRRNTRFVVLQVRRPSGNPQGKLNMGVALVDGSMKSMPLHNHANASLPPVENFRNAKLVKKMESFNRQPKNKDQEHEKKEGDTKIQLWRSLSMGSEVRNEDFPLKPGSVYNGSTANGNGSVVNGSELCSDIGPSASIVAAELARKLQPIPKRSNQLRNNRNTQHEETGSSILEDLTIEEARAIGYRSTSRWKKNGSDDESEMLNGSSHSRRHSDGGLFSCFVYGIGFTIACGANGNSRNSNAANPYKSRKNKGNSEASSE